MKYYIIFGPPGAGKGTQAKMMVDKFNYYHISTGELLRREIKNGTDLGKLAASYINNGDYVDDQIVMSMIKEEIQNHPEVEGFIFDGFPRTIEQAAFLDEMLKDMNKEVTSVISIKVDDDHVKHRIMHRAELEGRKDDEDVNVIEKRITTYHKKTEPLIEYYKNCGKYNEVDGHGSITEIFDIIVDQIE